MKKVDFPKTTQLISGGCGVNPKHVSCLPLKNVMSEKRCLLDVDSHNGE